MSTSSVAITPAPAHATLPLGFSRARYHDLDTNAPRLVFKIQDSAELEDQQAHEKAELASYYGKLRPSRAQTLLPDVLSEIFRQCGVPSPQLFRWGSLNLEMSTLLNILRVCSSWRAVALGTPGLWSELMYTDTETLPLAFYDQWLSRAAAVTLDLNIWPSFGSGEDSYWSGATALLHKHCNAIERLSLRLPVEDSGISLQPLFPHPHRLTSLRKLTVHSYDAFIHNTLSNIPWSQLSSIEFRVKYDTRFISHLELVSILSQAQNLTNLLLNLGPDVRFSPSSAQVLPLQNLRSLEMSWTDNKEYYRLGIVPHSFIDLFDKLRVPALKSLTLTVDKHINPYVLPALTGLAGRSGFSLEFLHIELCSPIPTALSPESTIAFLREQVSLNSLHWHSYGRDLSELVEALRYIGIDSETLLPNLVDISLGLNSYKGLLPAFTDMVASRRVVKSPSQTIAQLRSFHLKAFIPYRESNDTAYSDDPPPRPLLADEIKDANEKASRRLLDLAKQGLRGSLDFQHFDQALKFTKPRVRDY
ncbi:hypothetical protein B0H13DRAFT_1857673 [Mycena leptocephala]|nr:hypothetical protein B0H13DRAFT_1857673 [Mycena leptocephala]